MRINRCDNCGRILGQNHICPDRVGDSRKIETLCDFCGSPRMRFPSHVRIHNFCSHKCHSSWNTGRKNPKAAIHLRKVWIEKICHGCKLKFKVTPSQNYIKYCSQNCYHAYSVVWNKGKSKTTEPRLYAGEKHHLWKGGITKKEAYQRTLFKKTIRLDVLKRDNYTCVFCNKRGGILHVDHIQSWADYADLRFSMDNCRTLCQACHYKITHHKEFTPEKNKWGVNLKGGKYYGL